MQLTGFKHSKLSKYALIATFASVFFIMFAFAGHADVKADPQKTVKVGYYENEVFQEGASEGAVKKGYSYEYFHKMSEYTGWEYEYVYGSFGEMYDKFLNGEVDLLAGLAYTSEREEFILYPDEPMGNETYNLVKHATDEDITISPVTLTGKKIGVLDSAMTGILNGFLQKHEITANVVTFSDYTALFTAFDNGDIDVVTTEGDGASIRDNAEVLYAIGLSDYYLCVTKNRPDILEDLNAAQNQLMAEEPNYINSLKIKYYTTSISGRSFSDAEKDWLNSHSSLKIGSLAA